MLQSVRWFALAITASGATLGCARARPASPPTGPEAAPVAAPASTSSVDLPPLGVDCVRAVPARSITTHLTGTTSKPGTPYVPPDEPNVYTNCIFVRGGDQPPIEIMYSCGPDYDDFDVYVSEIRDEDGSRMAVTRIPGIGRGAFVDKSGLAAQHREHPCLIDLGGMADPSAPRWTELLGELEAALDPAFAKPASPAAAP